MKLLSKILLTVTILHGLFFAIVHYLGIVERSFSIVETLTIPVILLFYVIESEKIQLVYVFSTIIVFIADIVLTFFPGAQNYSISLLALGYLGYSIELFKQVDIYNYWRMLRISVIYIIVYLAIYFYIMAYLGTVSFEVIMFYNFFLAIFVILCLYLFFQYKNKASLLALVSAVAIIANTLSYCAVEFLTNYSMLATCGLEISFMIAHLVFSLFILKIEQMQDDVSTSKANFN